MLRKRRTGRIVPAVAAQNRAAGRSPAEGTGVLPATDRASSDPAPSIGPPLAAGLAIDLSRPRLVEFHRRLAELIPCRPETPDVRAALVAQQLPELLMTYLNWAARFVAPRRRAVSYSRAFWSEPRLATFGGAVLELERKIGEGADLTPHLSKKVHTHGFVPDRPSGGPDWENKDFALNAFGAHHLHLGRPNAAGRGNYTKELVFARFEARHAHMLMLGDHNSFHDGTLAAAAGRMNAETGAVLHGVIPEPEPFGWRDQVRLAVRGITSVGAVDGQATIGPMLSTAGTNYYHTRLGDEIMLNIEHYEPLMDDPATIGDLLNPAARQRLPAHPTFGWAMQYSSLLLVEEGTRTGFVMVQGFN